MGNTAPSATVKLFANGVDTGKSITLNAASAWKGSFSGLHKYADGSAIEYGVAEVAVPDFQSAISGSAADGFTVTNTYDPVTDSGTTTTPAPNPTPTPAPTPGAGGGSSPTATQKPAPKPSASRTAKVASARSPKTGDPAIAGLLVAGLVVGLGGAAITGGRRRR